MVSISSKDEDVIIAQCTPEGVGALALLRLTGKNVRSVVSAVTLLPDRKSIREVPSHTVHFGWIINADSTKSTTKYEKIDEVMFIVLNGPRTFTGQDTIEITCHNNLFIIDKIIQLALKHGARLAEAGEFSKRGFLSGKRDLIQTEAINELICASSMMGLKQSLAQVQGSLSQEIHLLSKNALKAVAWCEAQFEFLDEEVDFRKQIREYLEEIAEKIILLEKAYDSQKQIRHGIRIVLLGSVNAGKSSLFNTLLDEQRAIVTQIPGTTRDLIESALYRNGLYWTFVDTAGLRKTDDIIEAEGVRRAHEEAQKADVIVLVYDGSRQLPDEEKNVYFDILAQHQSKTIQVLNKSDLTSFVRTDFLQDCIAVSAYKKLNIQKLYAVIDQKVEKLFNSIGSAYLVNKRQIKLLVPAKEHLDKCLQHLNSPNPHYELISCHIKDFLELLSELSGKSIDEAGLDAVFREFCVGK